MKNFFWKDVIYTKNKEESRFLLEKTGYTSNKGKISKAYHDNNINELRLAKITQFCLSRTLNKDKKLGDKLKVLYDNYNLSKTEMFVFWAFLEGKMFNIIINETKKYLKNEINKSLINQEKFYDDIFEILTETINEDFLNAILLHKYFLEEKNRKKITAKETTNHFINNILGKFVWFKDVHIHPETFIINENDWNNLANNNQINIQNHYYYKNNIARIHNHNDISSLFNNMEMAKYAPPSVIIALEEFDSYKKSSFIKIIRLNIIKLLNEQINISNTINTLTNGNANQDLVTSNELIRIINGEHA